MFLSFELREKSCENNKNSGKTQGKIKQDCCEPCNNMVCFCSSKSLIEEMQVSFYVSTRGKQNLS